MRKGFYRKLETFLCYSSKNRMNRTIAILALAAPFLSAQVPAPESVLGHKPGDDFYLANYNESRDYFHKLAATSDRIKIINVGKTTRGLDWDIAVISSPKNLAQLDKYKEISHRLAMGRGLDDAERQSPQGGGAYRVASCRGGRHSRCLPGGVLVLLHRFTGGQSARPGTRRHSSPSRAARSRGCVAR